LCLSSILSNDDSGADATNLNRQIKILSGNPIHLIPNLCLTSFFICFFGLAIRKAYQAITLDIPASVSHVVLLIQRSSNRTPDRSKSVYES